MNPPPKQTDFDAAENGASKRLHEREAVQREVRLCWQNGQGSQVLQARALDMSRFGILVETDKAIAPGTVLSVQTNVRILGKACVRHCTPKGAKYRIGLLMPDRTMRTL